MIEDLLHRHSADIGIGLDAAQSAALIKFASLVAKWNRIFNLVGSSSPEALVKNHIVDCLAATPYISGTHIVDVGAGAGFPGIVIAIMRPQSSVSLVESSKRKSRFLRQVTIELSLTNVEVVDERIESWRTAEAFDCVVCRGYGSLRKFYDDTRALHRRGCRLVAMKGALNDQEIAELDLEAAAVSVQALTIHGWDQRHLITVSCTG